MTITANVAQTNLIGLKTKVVRSRQPTYKNISGIVVDETRNTFVLRNNREDKVIVKNVSVFHFTFPDGTIVEVDGEVIVGKPEDRVRKHLRRMW